MSARTISSAPTLEDLELKQLARKRREWALLGRLATGHTSDGFAMYAECSSCHASVGDWRAHLSEAVDLDAEEDDGPSMRLAYPGACSVCGNSVVDVSAEPR